MAMNAPNYNQKLDELDHLLNDEDVPIQPDRVWSLLAELVRVDIGKPGGDAGTSYGNI